MIQIPGAHRLHIARLVAALVLLGAGLWIGAATAAAAPTEPDTIQWRVIDWPPVYILKGPYKGKGTGDELIRLISGLLPEYRHERIVMSNARFDIQIKKGDRILNATGLPAPHLLHSIPTSIALPPHIIIRKDRIDPAAGSRCLSLDAVLSDSGLRCGITKGRYGPELNALIAPHLHHPWIHQSPNYMDLIRMLYAGRIDCTIEYPSIVRYFELTRKKTGITTAVPMCELSKARPYVTGHVLLPKTRWGEKMVKQINQILSDVRGSSAYRAILLRWAPQEKQAIFNQYLDELFSRQPAGDM